MRLADTAVLFSGAPIRVYPCVILRNEAGPAQYAIASDVRTVCSFHEHMLDSGVTPM